MGDMKERKQEIEKRRRGRPSKRAKMPISIPTTPDDLAAAVLTTTPSELKEWETRKSEKR